MPWGEATRFPGFSHCLSLGTERVPAPADDWQPLTLETLFAATVGTAPDVDVAIGMARLLLERSHELQTPQERRQQAELSRMVNHPHDKATLVEMTDQAFRTKIDRRVADQLTHILDVQGVPRFFSGLDRTMLRGFQSFGGYLPGVAGAATKLGQAIDEAGHVEPALRYLLYVRVAGLNGCPF